MRSHRLAELPNEGVGGGALLSIIARPRLPIPRSRRLDRGEEAHRNAAPDVQLVRPAEHGRNDRGPAPQGEVADPSRERTRAVDGHRRTAFREQGEAGAGGEDLPGRGHVGIDPPVPVPDRHDTTEVPDEECPHRIAVDGLTIAKEVDPRLDGEGEEQDERVEPGPMGSGGDETRPVRDVLETLDAQAQPEQRAGRTEEGEEGAPGDRSPGARRPTGPAPRGSPAGRADAAHGNR